MTDTKRRKAIILTALMVINLVVWGGLGAVFWAVYHFWAPARYEVLDHPGMPQDTPGTLITFWRLPEDASHVYIYVYAGLFGSYYGRATLPDEAFEAYREELLKNPRAEEMGALPEISVDDMERIKDWWPQEKTAGMTVISLHRGLDCVILETDNHLVWAVLQSD